MTKRQDRWSAMTRSEMDTLLHARARRCGTAGVIVWIRSVLLSDEQVRNVCRMLDKAAQGWDGTLPGTCATETTIHVQRGPEL